MIYPELRWEKYGVVEPITEGLFRAFPIALSSLLPGTDAGARGFTSGSGARCFAHTEEPFESFELRADVKVSRAVANLCFRVAPAGFEPHTGYQVRLGGRGFGGLYDFDQRRNPLVGHGPSLTRLLVRDEGWNGCFVRATGRRVSVWLNGVGTADLTDERGSLRRPPTESAAAPPT